MRPTDKTLLEQMQITEFEIRRRMELLDLHLEDLTLLSSHKLLIESNIDIIVDEFYEKQTAIDEISLLIGDADTLMHLRSAQRTYVLDLFSGNYKSQYVNNRLRIGMVHKRIGVEPKLYLSAVRTLQQIIIKTLKRTIPDTRILENTLDALDKLLCFDTTLVFDTYIGSLVSSIENARRKTEIYAKGLETQTKLDPLTNIGNQRALQELLTRELLVAKRHQTKLSLVYIDIDNFKHINDEHGHIKGDEVLKNIGKFLVNNIRETDIPCRYGGDEFCLILPECSIASARSICKKIANQFDKHYPKFSISFGIAETGVDSYLESEQLIKLADDKMYEAKKTSGTQICA